MEASRANAPATVRGAEKDRADARELGVAAAAARRLRILLLAAFFLICGVVLPGAWIVGAWAVGPKLNNAEMPFLTPGLFLLMLVAMPVSIFLVGRGLLRVEARLAARAGITDRLIRARRLRLADVRPPVPVLESDPLPPLPVSRRVTAGGLVALMFFGTLGLWLAAPLGSIWVASQMSSTSTPRMWPYLLIAVAIAVAMTLGVRLLARLQPLYTRVCCIVDSDGRQRRAAWLKSLTDERGIRRADRGLEVAMVAAVIVAWILLALWFFLLADPKSLLPPQFQQ
jgi:hypothetical protein